MPQATIAQKLGVFVAEARFADLPTEVVEKAKRHILDTFGAALAGATSNEARLAKAALGAPELQGAGAVWGTDLVSPRNAALLNGVAAHAFELDDTGGCDHSGAVVLPAAIAALSLADRPVSGREFITAVVLGYDLGRRALDAFGGYKPHNEAGWHSTGTCGTFAAAAAAASLLRLSSAQATSAIGLAGSFSSGLWAFIHDGSMAKRIHAGRAAEGGLFAAMLARSNVSGPAHVFEDVWGGFLNAHAHEATDREALSRDLGRTWLVMQGAIKPYACCRDTHAAVDAVDRILSRHPIRPEDVAEIRARLSPFLAGMVGGHEVDSLPAAQMSLPYAVAARVLFGNARLTAYAPERRRDPALLELIGKVVIEVDDTVAASDRASVALVTRDGARHEEPTTTALGAPENPLDDAGLIAKFDELSGISLAARQARELAETCLSLETVADMTELVRLLVPAPDAARRSTAA